MSIRRYKCQLSSRHHAPSKKKILWITMANTSPDVGPPASPRFRKKRFYDRYGSQQPTHDHTHVVQQEGHVHVVVPLGATGFAAPNRTVYVSGEVATAGLDLKGASPPRAAALQTGAVNSYSYLRRTAAFALVRCSRCSSLARSVLVRAGWFLVG
jgi:hypothetical protein